MTETNPTAAEFAALLAEAKVAERLCSDAKGFLRKRKRKAPSGKDT